MTLDIILIGPIGAGKSTVGALLSDALGLPQVSLDTVRFDYYKEIGYDEALVERLGQSDGFWAVYSYWKPFEAYAVERVLADHSGCVIDFGAGHSVYEDEMLFQRVKSMLALYKYVVLMLPSPDLDESVAILRERMGEIVSNGVDFHDHFTRHHSNHDLATLVVYTKDKTPEETCAEIVALINDGRS